MCSPTVSCLFSVQCTNVLCGGWSNHTVLLPKWYVIIPVPSDLLCFMNYAYMCLLAAQFKSNSPVCMLSLEVKAVDCFVFWETFCGPDVYVKTFLVLLQKWTRVMHFLTGS